MTIKILVKNLTFMPKFSVFCSAKQNTDPKSHEFSEQQAFFQINYFFGSFTEPTSASHEKVPIRPIGTNAMRS